jgi:hypothetical protein
MTAIELCYSASLLTASGIGIIRYKRLSLPLKLLTWSTIAIFIKNIAAIIVSAKYKTNAPVLHIEALTEYLFYAWIYYYLFTNTTLKKAVIVSMIVITVFEIFNAIYLQPFNSVFPTYIYLPTLALLAVLSLLLFRQMLFYPVKTPILKQGVFWYNTAIIFYSTTMFLTTGFSNIQLSSGMTKLIVYFWYAILYIFTILIGVALSIDKNNKSNA